MLFKHTCSSPLNFFHKARTQNSSPFWYIRIVNDLERAVIHESLKLGFSRCLDHRFLAGTWSYLYISWPQSKVLVTIRHHRGVFMFAARARFMIFIWPVLTTIGVAALVGFLSVKRLDEGPHTYVTEEFSYYT